MSEILRRSELDDLLDHIINSTDDWQEDVDRLLAHDAALRAENERLREAIEIEREGHAETRGAMAADDARLRDAAIRVWGDHIRGCDTPDEMAEAILALRESYGKAARRLAAAEECLREARDHALKYSDFGGMSHWAVRQLVERINAFLDGGKP